MENGDKWYRCKVNFVTLDEDKGIEIKELKVSLSRKSLWQEGLISNLINYFNYYKNEFR